LDIVCRLANPNGLNPNPKLGMGLFMGLMESLLEKLKPPKGFKTALELSIQKGNLAYPSGGISKAVLENF